MICSPIQGQRINIASKEYQHTFGLQLTDESCNGVADVELLVGADNYWKIVNGEVVHGEDEEDELPQGRSSDTFVWSIQDCKSRR